jgi:hypothetical protein
MTWVWEGRLTCACSAPLSRKPLDGTQGKEVLMDTGYYIQDKYIWGPKEGGRFYIENNYIYGPRNGGKYFIRDGYIYGPKDSGEFYIRDNRIQGPGANLPWMAED